MYPCPVCGYLTIAEPPGSYDICKVCGWEDDALQLEYATSLAGGANATTLIDAQAAYARAAMRLIRKHPTAAQRFDRDATWRPIDLERDHFPNWHDPKHEQAPENYERLYYWRETFWNWRPE